MRAHAIAPTPVGEGRLVIVVADDCHLCAHGKAVLGRLGLNAREIAVDSDEAVGLVADGIALSFLPVLTDGTRLIAYGRFSEKRLRRDLGL